MDSKRNPKRRKRETPDFEFRRSLLDCAKSNDHRRALSLYNAAGAHGGAVTLHLSASHYNTLLHLLSTAFEEEQTNEKKRETFETAFKVFDEMLMSGSNPTEATITTMARISTYQGPQRAFDMVKTMGEKFDLLPKLRTFSPALFGFCQSGDADMAYDVEEYMGKFKIVPEENELSALLDVSVVAGREDKVYEYLHKIRSLVGRVSESTAKVVEKWFRCERATEISKEDVVTSDVRAAVASNGGGWHGLGWLGKGPWQVSRAYVNAAGVCSCCGRKLACVDIDEKEVEKFAESVAALAAERKGEANFRNFQDWLENHLSYEAVIDGANIGFYQQNFTEGGFSLSQLDAVVRELQGRQHKWPLVMLHSKRVKELMENPTYSEILNTWSAEGALYKTPYGSNDDWYWLYAAVKLKCLVVTNDEMRDHIFELLGRSFFPKWKERHQVRYTFVKGALKLVMPPTYSVAIQELDIGSWHVPIDDKDNVEDQRTWLCITREGIYANSKSSHLSASTVKEPSVSEALQIASAECNGAQELALQSPS